MIFVDEQGNEIGNENSEPDWSVWASERTEEFTTDDGLIDIIMHCRKLTSEELEEQKHVEVQIQHAAKLNAVADLIRTDIEQSDKLGYLWQCTYIGDICVSKEYVEDPDAKGTNDNPIEWAAGIPLIPNAYYTHDSKKYVYVGEPSLAGDAWDETDFELVTW